MRAISPSPPTFLAPRRGARPKPSDRADVNYSGKFLMRVPKRLHAELAHAARAQSISLNQYVLYLLTKRHGERAKRVA